MLMSTGEGWHSHGSGGWKERGPLSLSLPHFSLAFLSPVFLEERRQSYLNDTIQRLVYLVRDGYSLRIE